MRFTSFLIAGVFALTASAQSSNGTVAATSASAVSSAPAPTDSAQAALLACLQACAPGDVNCRAKCVTVPNPDTAAVNKTIECTANCPQGNGTAADNKAYGDCVLDCRNRYFFATTSLAGATLTTGSAAAASTLVTPIITLITTGSTTLTSTIGSSTITQGPSSAASGTGASSSTSTSRAAGEALYAPIGSFGLAGFLAAVLAL